MASAVRPEVDDDFAKTLGAEGVAQLKELVGAQIAREYANAARLKLKRELLDQLEKAHDFELPPSLVDNEFAAIWEQLENNLQAVGQDLRRRGQERGRERARNTAGSPSAGCASASLIGEIGERNELKITQDEMRKALIEQARRYPGQEKTVYEYYEKTPGALAELRAPIFEDKVVDFILDKAKPADKKVSKDELFQKVEDATEA